MKLCIPLLLLLNLLIFESCKPKNNDFERLYSKIGIANSSFEISCKAFEIKDSIQFSSIPIMIFREENSKDSILLKKFLPKYADIILARILEQKDCICIVYGSVGDIFQQNLFLYDKEGNKTDSLFLLKGYCGEDEYMEQKDHSFIDKLGTITMTDTTKHFRIDTLDSVNPRKHTSTTVSTKVVTIQGMKFQTLKDTSVVIWEAPGQR